MKQSCLAVRELQAGAVALIKERKTVVRVAESHSFSWKGWDERKTYSTTFDNGILFPTASGGRNHHKKYFTEDKPTFLFLIFYPSPLFHKLCYVAKQLFNMPDAGGKTLYLNNPNKPKTTGLGTNFAL